MSELDKMIASLHEVVKPKNEFVEYQISNLKEIDTTPQPRQVHSQEQSWTKKVNYVFNQMKEGAESGNLSDRFHSMASQENDSATERSLTKTINRFYQQHSILQAYS